MVLFFDRDVGTVLPRVLNELKPPVPIEWHQNHFPIDSPDDVWMPIVGQWGWTVIGHDSQHHVMPNELAAIQQYHMGCFYLWGTHAPRWRKMQCFARAFDRIVRALEETARPFIFRVTESGLLREVSF